MNKLRPPKAADLLARLVLREDEFVERTGDLSEAFLSYSADYGRIKAGFWYWHQILRLLAARLNYQFFGSITMFRNYFKTTLRTIKRYKTFSIINIIGLTLGMAMALLIFQYVKYENSYDRFHAQVASIYRVANGETSTSPTNLAGAMERELPEIELAARVMSWTGFLRSERDTFIERAILFVDPGFLEMFTFPLMSRAAEGPLADPFSILVTKEAAVKYFGTRDPLGRTLVFNNTYDFKVTGVLENVPDNSHLKFDFLGSMEALRSIWGEEYVNRWGSNDIYTYVKLNPRTDAAAFQAKLSDLAERHREEDPKLNPVLQPLTGIHLGGNLMYEMEANSSRRTLTLLSAIASIILLIACFNFMNLSTAMARKRGREVGIRKVVGFTRRQLIGQFYGEALIFSLISLGLALLVVRFALPVVSSFLARPLTFNLLHDPAALVAAVAVTLLTGLVAGSYPALLLSSIQPVKAIRGRFQWGSRGRRNFRTALVVFQFAVSMVLLVSSIVVYNQLRFLKTRSFGDMRDTVLYIHLSDRDIRMNPVPLKTELLRSTHVTAAAAFFNLPIMIPTGNYVYWEGMNEEDRFIVRQTKVDQDFLDFYGLEIVKGRSFFRDAPSDAQSSILINETTARRIGWEDPIGRKIRNGEDEGVVIGVLKDFNFKPLYEEIEPLAVTLLRDEGFFAGANYVSLKIALGGIREALAEIEDIWKRFAPSFPFVFGFMDERIAERYRAEHKMGEGFTLLAAMAVFLACLGIFGMSLFTAEEKVKEIGIRKVLGASSGSVVFFLSRQYVKWVGVAAVIALPLSWFVMQRWLEKFVYRAAIGIGPFVAALIAALFFALATVSIQSLRSALADPVRSIRCE